MTSLVCMDDLGLRARVLASMVWISSRHCSQCLWGTACVRGMRRLETGSPQSSDTWSLQGLEGTKIGIHGSNGVAS